MYSHYVQCALHRIYTCISKLTASAKAPLGALSVAVGLVLVISGPLYALSTEHPAPSLTSNVSEIEFDTVYLGETSSKTFVLTNNALDANNEIRIESIYMHEVDERLYTTNFEGPVVLKGGESHAIEVTFKPERSGETLGTLFVSHTGSSGVKVYTLQGSAISRNGSASTRKLSLQSRAIVNPSIGFGKSQLSGFSNVKPTSLQFGPDDKLYVADMFGLISVYSVNRNGANAYSVTNKETITLVRDILNHDDNGQPNYSIVNRLVTGLTVVGSATNPIIYVASSDPRIGGGASHTETNLDTNSGVISKLYKQNGVWKKLDLVRGLPRSEENHHTNGLHYDEASNMLYVAAGGNTNQGATSHNFALLPEYALSAAILSIDLTAIGNTTYDLPTLDDQTRAGTQDSHDPFGGNNGLNQAKLVPGGPVQVYAPGFRNAYDIEVTQKGHMFTIDNGPNSGWGGTPVNEGPNGVCTNGVKEPGSTFFDGLHLISGQGYYGGHANPTRGNNSNTFNPLNPQSPVAYSNPIECDYKGTGTNGSLSSFGTSVNGLIEYTGSNLNNQLNGDLLAAAFDNKIYRIKLNDAGTTVLSKTALFSNVGTIPLDVTAQGDDDLYPGTIWVADFVEQKIYIFEPSDYSNAASIDNGSCENLQSHLDHDADGFSNGDELANNTNPCSAADMPSDADGDFTSDLLDTDDDNDGLDDEIDPFALDDQNGRGTQIPLSYNWENNSTAAGFLFNLGFSGLMNNGTTDYLNQFSQDQLTAGGAAGVFTIDNIPGGDPINGLNSQEFGFQFGINATPSTKEFTVHTRILAPFSGLSPQPSQSMGFYIGTGDQDNYIKLVADSTGSNGGVQFGAERNGVFEWVKSLPLPLTDAESIDLLLTVNPSTQSVKASYQLSVNGISQAKIDLSPETTFPISWLSGETGLAVGIIATSYGAAPFSATWDFIDVYYTDGSNGMLDDSPAGECPVTMSVGDKGYGIAASDNALGTGWILWSEEDVFSRFSPAPFPGNAKHFIAVKNVDGDWHYDNNGGLFKFNPTDSDCLVATVNFSNDTVSLLSGESSSVLGINAGFTSGDLNILPNQWAGMANLGEFGVSGSTFGHSSGEISNPNEPVEPVTPDTSGIQCPVTMPLGNVAGGIAAMDQAIGNGWILWSKDNVFTRFSSSPHPNNAEHLISVKHTNGQWFYDNNGGLVPFSPSPSDCLIASVNFSTDLVTLLEGTNSVINGIASGYSTGDVAITANVWNGYANNGEFGVTGSYIASDSEPEITEPETTEPETTEPETTEPETTEPETTEPETTEPETTEPETTEPETTEPETTEPETTEPETTEPETTEPETTEPETTEPETTEPETTEPETTEPETTEPETTEPETTEPETTEPETTEPETTEPETTEPETTEPDASNSLSTCPVSIDVANAGYGIAASDNAVGNGWILWSEKNVFTRFNPAPLPGNAQHFVAVKNINNQWFYDNNGGLFKFEPSPTDCLVASIDFSNDTVSELVGVKAVIHGIDSGYGTGDFSVIANQWANTFNMGEFGISGTTITQSSGEPETTEPETTEPETTEPETTEPETTEPETTEPETNEPEITQPGVSCPAFIDLGDVGYGIAADDNATGTGWVMWSEENVFDRFSPSPLAGNAHHLVAVKYVDGQWAYDKNGGVVDFEPRTNDCLLATIDFTNDSVTLLSGVNEMVNGIDSGYMSGDLDIIPNQWAGWPNAGEFGIVGNAVSTNN